MTLTLEVVGSLDFESDNASIMLREPFCILLICHEVREG